ncbi:MAG TPA: tetratricopeptide repeat protein [Polyangia bacterium]|nr:tetratricopeptide repeat protein [Polyangia bacterium]
MPPAPDGDDEEVVEIEFDVEGPPPAPVGTDLRGAVPEAVRREDTDRTQPGLIGEAGPSELLDIVDVVELRPPIVEAADDDPRAAIELFRAEAAAGAGARRAGLLVEVAELEERLGRQESNPAGDDLALTSARAAFAGDPASVVAFWTLRRLLGRAGRWAELAEIHAEAARARASGSDPTGRADLLVARGRLLEDRLDRGDEALAAYREALAVVADHPGALLALWLAGVRRNEAGLRAEALAGLSRIADAAPRRGALVVEEARAWREARADGAARALVGLGKELARGDADSPLATLLAELDGLTRGAAPPDVADRALAILGERVSAADPRLAVALWRERAYLLRRTQSRPQAALEALDEAARLGPAHPAVAAERVELALALDRGAVAAEIVRGFIAAAARDDDAVDVALLFAAICGPAEAAEAAALLEEPRVLARRPSRVDLRAAELAIAVRNHEPAALAEALAGEAEAAPAEDGPARVLALIAAGAVRAAALGEADAAAELYRRALALDPTLRHARPAVQALAALSIAAGRIEEAAGILEHCLTVLAQTAAEGDTAGQTEADRELERWMREMLVGLYADQMGQPGRAIPHQRRLVVLRPRSLAARARLHDFDLEAVENARLDAVDRAGNLLAMADLAKDADAANALRLAAGRTLVASPDPGAVARGTALLSELIPADPSGLAGSALEWAAATPQARAAVVAAELAAQTDAAPEYVRALRFRLAYHQADAGAYAEAVAALTPLRAEGDPIARAWSDQLARRSGDAILEVAVLSEEARLGDGTVADPANVLLAYGEALARAGDPGGAAEAFRRAIVESPLGETAPAAALALFRLASGERAAERGALGQALSALAQSCAEEPAIAAAAAREAALSSLAAGVAVSPPETTEADTPSARADAILWQFLAGVRGQDAAAAAEALAAMGIAVEEAAGFASEEALALYGRAAARARLAGFETADRVAAAVWHRTRAPALAPAVSDLPVAAGGSWPAARPDPRRARARRVGGTLAIALHLEAAMDAERAGDLAGALAAYGSVIGADPLRLEAWSGVRRVARAGGDTLGEARALARLGALVRDPHRAAGLLVDAGAAYEHAGRADDAIAALARAVELDPDSTPAYEQAHRLLRLDLQAPGRAETLDGLLSYRLAAARLSRAERLALLFERGRHRLQVEGGLAGALEDFKQILKFDPENLEALRELAQATTAAGDSVAASQWIERYLLALDAAAGRGMLAADPVDASEAIREARLALASSYEASGDVARAVTTLRRAADVSPDDPRPLEQLAEVLAGRGDVAGAVAALQAAAARLFDPAGQASRWIRIGEILRDRAGDAAAAAAAFRQAADLAPLGPGVALLTGLYDAGQDARGALQIIEREIANLRQALAANPLDVGRLERLTEWLAEARRRGGRAGGEAAVASVRALAEGRPVADARAPAPPKQARALLASLADPDAGGFTAEIWPHLAEVAEALFPPPAAEPLAPAVEARLAWLRPVAAALEVPRLDLLARASAGPSCAPLDRAPPALVVDVKAPAGDLAFWASRALALLALRAGALDRKPAADLGPLFSCAAVLAGGAVPKRLPKPGEGMLREVSRLLGRKDRKALALQASRFGFEPLDLDAWRAAVLRVADRFALLVVDDPALAAAARAGGATAVAGDTAARDLLSFALSETYVNVRRAAGRAEGT